MARAFTLAVPIAAAGLVVAGTVAAVVLLPRHVGCQASSDGAGVGYVCPDGNAYAFLAVVAAVGFLGVSMLGVLMVTLRTEAPDFLAGSARLLETALGSALVVQLVVSWPLIENGGYTDGTLAWAFVAAAWGVLLVLLRTRRRLLQYPVLALTCGGLLALALPVVLLAPLLIMAAFVPLFSMVMFESAVRAERRRAL